MKQTKFSEFAKVKKRKKSKELIKKQFITNAKKIWKNKPEFIEGIKVDVEIRDDIKHMAQLRHDARARQWASGDYIYRCPKAVTLDISKKALGIPEKQLDNIIGHEAIHLGYGRHDQNFRKLAAKHNIGVTYNEVRNLGVKLQYKEGHRYKTHKVFKTKREADEYYNKHLRGKTKKQWRTLR